MNKGKFVLTVALVVAVLLIINACTVNDREDQVTVTSCHRNGNVWLVEVEDEDGNVYEYYDSELKLNGTVMTVKFNGNDELIGIVAY